MICKCCKARFETRDADPDEFNTGYCFKCLHKMGYYDNKNKYTSLYSILEKITEEEMKEIKDKLTIYLKIKGDIE